MSDLNPKRKRRAAPSMDRVMAALRQCPNATRATLLGVLGSDLKPTTLSHTLFILKARGMAEPSGVGRGTTWRAKA